MGRGIFYEINASGGNRVQEKLKAIVSETLAELAPIAAPEAVASAEPSLASAG